MPSIPSDTALWVDKYAPKTKADLAGNKNVIEQFESWLRDWDDVVLRGMTKPVAFRKGQNPMN